MLKRELAVNRRKFVAGVGSVLAAPPLISAAQQPPIKLGQCVDFSGSIADLGKAIHQGAQLCFNSVNAAGGINGRQIVLDARDDGYDAKRSVAYAKEFAADPDVVALFNCVGTPAAQAILPIVHGAGIPFFAPLTGGLVARPPWREVFNIRPSYSAEAEQLVKHISTVGLRKIGIAQQNSVFGKEVLDGASAAATRYELPAPVVAQVESDGSNAAAAAEKFAASDVQAVVVGLAGAAATGFVKQMRLKRKGIQLYALSVLGAAGSIKGLGSDAIGLTISQVVPLPSKSAIPIVGEYLRAWNASKANDGEPSHLGLEGYINARVMVEGLRRAGRNVTRGGLIESLWSGPGRLRNRLCQSRSRRFGLCFLDARFKQRKVHRLNPLAHGAGHLGCAGSNALPSVVNGRGVFSQQLSGRATRDASSARRRGHVAIDFVDRIRNHIA